MTFYKGENASGFGEALRNHLQEVERDNSEMLEAVAGLLHDVIRNDGLIFAAGSGHSNAMVLETFYRAGGLACVYPMYHPALLPLEGGVSSTLMERTENLAEILVEQASPTSQDATLIFSNSGVNKFPVELACKCREYGTPIVALVSVPHMEQAPLRAEKKLADVADYIVNTKVPYGDAVYQAGDSNTAAISSLVSVYCWNMLLARIADQASQSGIQLPLWESANVCGGDKQNSRLLARYRGRIPQI